jgi:hypothetical protein
MSNDVVTPLARAYIAVHTGSHPRELANQGAREMNSQVTNSLMASWNALSQA